MKQKTIHMLFSAYMCKLEVGSKVWIDDILFVLLISKNIDFQNVPFQT